MDSKNRTSGRDLDAQVLSSPNGIPLAKVVALPSEEEGKALVYSSEDRKTILGQIKIVLSMYYVHKERKQAQYGFDALRAIERLVPIASELSDEEFHQSVVGIMSRVRDRHFTFFGRTPNGALASLPFSIERCWINGSESYVVTKLKMPAQFQYLKVGAIVTHWNGTPIQRYVRLTANFFDGGNDSAAIARSMAFLTDRDLSMFAAPQESWVILTFVVEGTTYEERFQWMGLDLNEVPIEPAIGRNVAGYGCDFGALCVQMAKRIKFAPQTFDPVVEVPTKVVETGVPRYFQQTGNINFGSVATENGVFGYIRVFNFQAFNADGIVRTFLPIMERLPQDGLIIDMRENVGGYIAAGERLLQLFTPRSILPTRFQFRVTEGTRKLLGTSSRFEKWKKSVEEAFLTGETYTQGFPIEGTDADANLVGQRYYGPVVLITDALAFSTADIFAAGFIDHGIGRVICIDKNMAAAGSNNWSFDTLLRFANEFPIEAEFKSELDAGILSPKLRNVFKQKGLLLGGQASIQSGRDHEGDFWTISDEDGKFNIRSLGKGEDLNVNPVRKGDSLSALPEGVGFSFTARRCVRTGKNEGRLLEDLGIEPDIVYWPTLRDVTDRNRDLLNRAGLELSKMPGFGLIVRTETSENAVVVTCLTKSISSIEVFNQDRHLASSLVSSESKTQFELPRETKQFIIKGFDATGLVAKRIVNLNK